MKATVFLGVAFALFVAQARAVDVTVQSSGIALKDHIVASNRSRVPDSGQAVSSRISAVATQTEALSEAQARAGAKFARAMRIVERFQSEATRKGLAGNNWRTPLINRMMHGSETEFASVELARSLNEAMAAASHIVQAAASKSETATPEAIGSATYDLTYFPITPCRILDTRGTVGPLAAGSAQSYSYDVVNPGASSACSVFNQFSGHVVPTALAINVTVDESALSGFPAGAYLQIYPQGGSTPTSFINFAPGQIIANAGVISENQTTGEFTVFTSAPAQVIIDVYGVFVEPRATTLDCTYTAMSTQTLAAGSFGITSSPSCPSGKVLTGGNCDTDTVIPLIESRVNGSSWSCSYNNTSAASATIYAFGTCCRVPGQ